MNIILAFNNYDSQEMILLISVKTYLSQFNSHFICSSFSKQINAINILHIKFLYSFEGNYHLKLPLLKHKLQEFLEVFLRFPCSPYLSQGQVKGCFCRQRTGTFYPTCHVHYHPVQYVQKESEKSRSYSFIMC